jgi:archaetidylinositol phosphate synthase
MVLNNLRAKLDPILASVGKALARTGVTPDALTYLGFAFALLAGFLYAVKPSMPYLAAVAILASGAFDILDGAVARVTSKISKRGSFTDSTLDRLSEVLIYAGITYGAYNVAPFLVLLTLGFSLLVSYVRAKSDSLNIKMSGIGIGERAERLVALAILSIFGFVSYGIYLVLILSAVTFVQRYAHATRVLSSSPAL